MIRRFLFLLPLLLLPAAPAQTVSGTKVMNGWTNDTLLHTGHVCFDSSPCFTVTNGSFTGTVSAGTYTITVKDEANRSVLNLLSVPIGSDGWVYDTYVMPLGYPPAPTSSGVNPPYLPCTSGAYYTQINSSLPSNSVWICGDTGQQNQWYNAVANPSTQLVNPYQWMSLIGVNPPGPPAYPCSPNQNNRTLYTDLGLDMYQCSAVTGAWQWNEIGSSGGTVYPGANTIGVGNSANNGWRTPGYADILALWSGTKDAAHCTAGDGTMQPCSGGGITANPLIFATSGGAAPSGTFNGSAAVTIDYHSLGAQQVLGYTPTNAAVMPSTAPGAGYIPIGNAGGTAYAPLSLSGDCSLASTGAITCTKSNGTAFASGAFAAAYSLPGTVVQTNQANTFGAYLQDFSAATQMKLPVASGYTSAANGEIGYDSSGNNWHGWVNGADMFAAFLPKTGMTNNHCVEFAVSGSTITLADAGGTCTTGGSMVWPATPGIVYWTSGTTWGGAYNSSTPIPANYLPLALSSSTSVNGTSIPASATLCIVSSLCSGYQAALTNPVTGPGSGVTIGHMAVMGNTSGTSITDGGAIPSVGTWGALNYPSWSSGTPFVKMTAAGTFSLDTNTYASSSASTTVNGQTCTLGSTCTIPFQTNSSGNTSQAGINLLTSTANSVGLTVTPTNSATNTETFEVTGTYSGGISSSQVTTGLGYTPANCTSGTATSDCITNAMTTLGDLLYGGASGASTRLTGPTGAAATTYVFTNTTNGSSQAQIPAWANAPSISAANMTGFPTIVSLTTTGTPGPATLSGNAINIPTGVKWFGSGNANVGGSLPTSATGNQSTAVGNGALAKLTSGSGNVVVGADAGYNLTTGYQNVAIGPGALFQETTGSTNIAIGAGTLSNQIGANANIAIGQDTLESVSVGDGNVGMGDNNLLYVTTGSGNTAIGNQAGMEAITSNFNTYLGANTTANADGYTNSTALGAGAVITASNQVVLGNTSVTKTLLNGSVGIGTTNPGQALVVNGVIQSGSGNATDGTILLKATYDSYPAQLLFTEYGSGGIGLSTYMYQNNSSTWLSSFNYGSTGRGALIVTDGQMKFYNAPSQNVAPGSPLTTQPTTAFLVDVTGNVGIGTTAPGSLLTVKGGDAFVDGSAKGLILRDTVVTTNCYRITIASGVITPTLVTCPTD